MLTHHRIILIVAAVASFTILLNEAWVSVWIEGFTSRSQSSSVVETATELRPSYVALPIDHSSNNTNEVYNNRYWINTEFYSPGGPVFVHDVGEVNAESSAKKYLEHPSSYLRQYLKDFRGIGIVWEHRYYGESLPFPIGADTPLKHFRYHTLNQSLADLPYFAWNFSLLSLPHLDLTPASTPWIMIGCSYSGLRAAFSRSRYPETFHAAYAASAPVELQVNLDHFFDPVYNKMVNRGYGTCAQDLHAAMQFLDIQLSTPHNAMIVKRRMLGPGAEVNNNGDFTLAVANIYSYFQSYGMDGGKNSLSSLCEYMKGDGSSDLARDGSGLSVRYGGQAAFERLASWPGLVAIINSHFNTNCSVSAERRNLNCDLGDSMVDVNGASWSWQLCSELGLFVTQNAGAHSLVSRYQSLEYRKSLCIRQFPKAQENGLLPSLPASERINAESGGRQMRPSNVFWTAGEYDPWRALTPLVMLASSSPQSYKAVASQQIPSCGESTGVDSVFGYVMEDAQHCLDYSSSSTEAAKARTKFAEALRQWLPCYKGQSQPQSIYSHS